MSGNKSKDELIAERQANLELPEDPPVASDWNSANANINASAETKQEEAAVGTSAGSETGVDKGPASTDNPDLSNVGRTDRS